MTDEKQPTEEEKNKAAEEWATLNGLSRALPNIGNYSVAKRVAVGFLGPTVRIWRKSNVIQIGYDRDGRRYLLGEGPDYTSALRLVAFTLAQAAAKHNAELQKQPDAVSEGKAVEESGQKES